MASGGGRHRWSVFDGVKTFPSSPEALMSEVNAAIAASEYVHASYFLQSPASSSSSDDETKNNCGSGTETDSVPQPQYDARLADEAYRAGCAALAVGKPNEAFHSLSIALSKCPPDKRSALAKLHSLISLASQQLQKLTPTST
ncbi:hypothetical protein NE237_018223 [Protea cynaroides]|uniref:PE-PPE domain-containing protein n=1 Tax=Protea cynaroides TaxID=273540 RepID=A0A9Q0QNZ3_9MAGN|nr:hypothetical protein NE237_018223 [Protea cynaroides]